MQEKKDIKVVCWLKNNTEWYYPTKTSLLDLSMYDNVNQLTIDCYYGDLYVAWNGHTDKERLESSVIFRTK